MSIWERTKQFIGFEEELMEGSPLKLQKGDTERRRERPQKAGRVINFPQQKVNSKMQVSPNDVMIIEPSAYEDSLIVSTWLKKNNPVVVNIKHLDAATGKRFVDFICGSAYAFEGHMHRLGGTIFMFTPAHMAIVPTSEEEISQHRPQMPEGILEDEVVYDEPQNTHHQDYEYFDPIPEEQHQEVNYG